MRAVVGGGFPLRPLSAWAAGSQFPMTAFSSAPSSNRTAGFPQYGFPTTFPACLSVTVVVEAHAYANWYSPKRASTLPEPAMKTTTATARTAATSRIRPAVEPFFISVPSPTAGLSVCEPARVSNTRAGRLGLMSWSVLPFDHIHYTPRESTPWRALADGCLLQVTGDTSQPHG